MITRSVISDLTGVSIASWSRLFKLVSEWREIEQKAVQKEQWDSQTYFSRSVDPGEYLAAFLVDDNNLANRDFAYRGNLCREINRPQPVQSGGAFRLPHADWTVRVVVERKPHSGEMAYDVYNQA
ncbi:MAG: hypothetical protein OXG15_02800 [Gammaproteobacteria bacterium]|nr:hypothetical protein [Gammaproteobacteria bacterium]